MIRFSDLNKVDRILAEVASLIKAENLERLFDGPIRASAKEFKFDRTAQITHPVFLDTISSFVQYVYCRAWTPRQHLSLSQAGAEAILLLEKHYRNNAATGYDAAYLDALNPTFYGIEFILEYFTQLFIHAARNHYVQWVFHSRIDGLEWSKRRELAAKLIGIWQSIEPQGLKRVNPSQMADHCAALLLSLISSEDHISHTLSS